MVSLRISTSKICAVVMWQTYFFATEKANKLAPENGLNLWKMLKISYYPLKYSKTSRNFLHANFSFVQIFLLFVYCFFFTLFICYFTVYLNLYLSFITTCKTKLFTSAVFQICLEFHALNIHKILQNH